MRNKPTLDMDERRRKISEAYNELVPRFKEFLKGDFTYDEAGDFCEALNKEYEKRTGSGITPCFTTRLWDYVEEQREKGRKVFIKRSPDSSEIPKKKKPKLKKSQKEKLAIRLETGLISEKGLAFSLLESGTCPDKSIDMDYRTWWIGDSIAWAIIEDYGMPWMEIEKHDFYMNHEELKKAEEYLLKLKENHPHAYSKQVPQATLTSFQIREKIGRKKLLNSEIHDLVKKFVGVPIERKSKKKIGRDGDSWIRFGEIDNICKVKYIETGKLSQRNRQPEYCYKFIFDRAASLDFWNSLRLGFFDCRPPSYYSLKGGSQLLLRAIGWTANPTDIELEHACRITGIQSKHKTIQQKSIEGYLDELNDDGFISGWKKRAKKIPGIRRNKVWYKILKVRHMPNI